jgi:transposase-like protein
MNTVKWKVIEPGLSVAYCPKCDVELKLSKVFYTIANPKGTAGEQVFVCPKCKKRF